MLLAAPLIARYEGERTQAYADPVGIPTICFGHTAGVRLGQTATPEQCAGKLVADTRAALADVDRCTPGLPDRVRAALASFAYNVGGGAYCRSTLAQYAKRGNIAAACAELSRWTYAGGRELPGLVKRRAAERAMCEGRA